jgi:hypothetical protein
MALSYPLTSLFTLLIESKKRPVLWSVVVHDHSCNFDHGSHRQHVSEPWWNLPPMRSRRSLVCIHSFVDRVATVPRLVRQPCWSLGVAQSAPHRYEDLFKRQNRQPPRIRQQFRTNCSAFCDVTTASLAEWQEGRANDPYKRWCVRVCAAEAYLKNYAL